MTDLYDNIQDMARARADATTAAGRDPKPWLDKSRDFIAEAQEEAADGSNYTKWGMKQLSVLFEWPEDVPAQALNLFVRARTDFASAFEALHEARIIINAALKKAKRNAAVSAAMEAGETPALQQEGKPNAV